MTPRVSLRTRLALLYAGLALIVLAISLVSVYEVAHRDALSRVDSSLRSDARKLGGLAEGAEHGNENDSGERFVHARDAVASGHLLALYDDHRVIAATPEARALATKARASGLFAAQERGGTIDLPSGSFKVSVVPIDRGEYAMAAAPLQPVVESMEGLLHATLLAGVVGVILTSIGAWFAARRGLRPLESITTLANEVAPDALGLRTGLENRDEIGAVAAAIDRMLNRLETAFESQKRFLEDASHELRTPLTIARGHLELLAEDPDATAQRRDEAVTVAIEEIDRMGRLVDGLLQLARASEVERLNIVAVPVGPLLKSIASQLSRLGGRDWSVTGGDQLTAAADEDALRQIVLNLARNADEHSPPDRGIELAAVQHGQEVRITVTDRGSGIDPMLHGHLFERFTHDGDGIGLGLAISRALAESQHGSIALEDRPGGGAIATVTVPSA
jgi:signal transduction histidine kinase